MAEPYLGEIKMVGFNFAPQGWFLCNGQTLAIQQYTALFSLIGTYYGGNGINTFQLPNLQGRVPIHQGTGAGLTTRVIGEQAGTENTTLLYNNMPLHTHTLNVTNGTSNMASTAGGTTALNGQTESGESIVSTNTPSASLAPTTVGTAGGNVPFNNIQPYLVVNFIIAYVGIFPSRN
jgi:microcystin-dependent protein